VTNHYCATGCGQPTRDVLLLCRDCLGQVRDALAEMPSLIGHLSTTITRQDVMAPTTGGKRQPDPDDGRNLPNGAHPQPMAFNLHASDLLDELRIVLHGWTRVLVEDHDQEPPTDSLRAMSVFLYARLDLIARHEAADDIHREIVELAYRDPEGLKSGKAWRAVDRPADLVFVGPCGQCSERLYVHPGAKTATCRWCNADHNVEDVRGTLVDRLAGVLMTVSEIVHWGVKLGHFTEPKRTRNLIDQWVARGQLVAHGKNGLGRKTYPFGEVLRMLRESQQARATRKAQRVG
jgi:hypothetical protein